MSEHTDSGLLGHACIVVGDLNDKLKKVEQQRDDLLAACRKLHSSLLAACSYPACVDAAKYWRIDLLEAEAAIDKA